LPVVQITDITYEADGRTMVGQYAVDEHRVGPRPAVLLCHEGPGLDGHVKGRAVRLASLGYAAFALDYHGGEVPLEDAMTRMGDLATDATRCRAIARAGLGVLLAQDGVDPERVAAIGYCFGGVVAMELARDSADIKAVVGFHPGLSTGAPATPGAVQGSVLMCCGAEDPVIGFDERSAFEREMRDAGVADWRIELYGGVGHSFTNPQVDELGMPGFAYDAAANRRSWRSLLALPDERLGPAD
jgi:dienelactone hydrolase